MVASFFQLLGSHTPSCLELDMMRWKLCKNGVFSLKFFLSCVEGCGWGTISLEMYLGY